MLGGVDYHTLPSQLFVLGTDTNVGKTTVARRLALLYAARQPVVYRKPFQTGVTAIDDPTSDAAQLTGLNILAETGLVLRQPLSVLAAAEVEGIEVDLEALLAWTLRPVPTSARLLIEGLGGVLVPLAPRINFADWAASLGIPAVIVARGGLGTLNHTQLTVEAWCRRGGTVAAVLLNPGLDQSFDAARKNQELLRRMLGLPIGLCPS